MSKFLILSSALLGTVLWSAAPAHAESQSIEVLKKQFVRTTSTTVDPEKIKDALEKAQYSQAIIDSISKPWEAKPWHQYHPIFLTDKRLAAGLEFWDTHHQAITNASKQYNVDPEIIVAIIGIETFYGQYKGKHKVLDALYTLGFYYPPRAKFFRSELAEFLKLVDEEQLNMEELKGSYAGAMGYGQFISSSYRHYAVDFDGDGKRDILNSPVDAIGSVANYFHRHGWKMGEAVALPLEQIGSTPEKPKTKVWSGERLHYRVSDILSPQLSLAKAKDIDINQKGMLIALEQKHKTDYWLGLKNFYVITRYNHSPLYAMAALQFSQQLKRAYHAQ